MTVMLVAWMLPWIIQLGGVRLSPYRLVLIVMFLPCLIACFSGSLGRIRTADWCILLYGLWCIFSLMVLHGIEAAIQTGGVLFIETTGAYFMARRYIRDVEDFLALVRFLFLIVAVLMPIAAIETFTGHNLALEVLSYVFPTPRVSGMAPRWGLTRAQTIFEHPILMGVCCGVALALTHMILGRGKSFGVRWLQTLIVGLAVLLSLSSCPLSGLTMQIGLMMWNWTLGKFAWRWKVLIVGLVSGAIFIEAFSNSSLLDVLYSRFAFEPQSALFRILIWDIGTQSIANHPWFGIGLGEWERPSWMPPSIDMFWLYHAILYGLPAGILMAVAFLATMISVGLRKGFDERLATYRTAYLISMTALCAEGWMVHYWNGAYVLVLVLLGAGAWFLDAGGEEPQAARQKRSRPGAARTRPSLAATG